MSRCVRGGPTTAAADDCRRRRIHGSPLPGGPARRQPHLPGHAGVSVLAGERRAPRRAPRRPAADVVAVRAGGASWLPPDRGPARDSPARRADPAPRQLRTGAARRRRHPSPGGHAAPIRPPRGDGALHPRRCRRDPGRDERERSRRVRAHRMEPEFLADVAGAIAQQRARRPHGHAAAHRAPGQGHVEGSHSMATDRRGGRPPRDADRDRVPPLRDAGGCGSVSGLAIRAAPSPPLGHGALRGGRRVRLSTRARRALAVGRGPRLRSVSHAITGGECHLDAGVPERYRRFAAYIGRAPRGATAGQPGSRRERTAFPHHGRYRASDDLARRDGRALRLLQRVLGRIHRTLDPGEGGRGVGPRARIPTTSRPVSSPIARPSLRARRSRWSTGSGASTATTAGSS